MRIVAGELRGRKLHAVKGAKTRPTADRVREAVFNILGKHVAGTRVLDLFAGTGAFGIEALSRGSLMGVFADKDRDAVTVLKRNLKSLDLMDRATVIRWDITRNLKFLCSWERTFDLVFMDPPYHRNMVAPVLHHLENTGCLQQQARIVVEHHWRDPLGDYPRRFHLRDQRKYGKTLVSFFNYML